MPKDQDAARPPGLAAVAVGLTLLLVVAAIGWAVERGPAPGIDAGGILAMAGGPTGFWLFWTRIGDQAPRAAILAAGAVALLLRHRRARAGLLVGVVLAGAALNSAVKLVFTRVRPGLLPHLDRVDTFSFPSGHAANSMTLALALALLVAPARWRGPALAAAATVALLIGLSRIALAVHWPTDVAAGWIEGIGFTCLWFGIRARLGARWEGRHG